ncbi:ITGAV (predicted) [Pycnogonum litorale]
MRSTVTAFNVDLDSRVVHTVTEGQWFGFSVALHIDKGNGWLLVGAPKAQTNQLGVRRGGAVYKCSPNIANACQTIKFDVTGNNHVIINGRMVQNDSKSEQWFGATVVSAGQDGPIVACAPRYVYYSQNLKRRDPVGTCYVALSSFSGFREYSPCRTNSWGYHRQGSCQAGISAAISKDGRRLFIGAVGSWYWQGQVFSQNLLNKGDRAATTEDAKDLDTSYMGFSSAVGEFSGDDDPDVVVGRPRGGNLSGQILLFNSTLHSLFNISGEQIGSYFGYSVAVISMNDDKLDDVIVGAPLYDDFTSKDGSYETGRVYVFYQTKRHTFGKNWDTLDGRKSKGRFGLALSSLGDINNDGFGDIAVGAPYDGITGKGVVYIFHGSKRGIRSTPSQVLSAEDIDPAFKTFGFSLSGGMDLDSNEYPDLLVGAYDSDSVAFFRSRPVVSLKTSVTRNQETINLDLKGCILADRATTVPCITVISCFTYKGIGVETNIEIEYKVVLDVDKRDNPRLFFLGNEGINVLTRRTTLTKQQLFCKNDIVYVPNDIVDKLTPIAVKATPKLINRPRRQISKRLWPILDQDIPISAKERIHILKECGSDQICIPDIALNITVNKDKYVIGQQDSLQFNVSIINRGEDAYEAYFFLEISDLVNLDRIESLNNDNLHVECLRPSVDDKNTSNVLVCQLGNPLPSNQSIQFEIYMTPMTVKKFAKDFEFKAIVNSSNPEDSATLRNNHQTVIVDVQVNSSLKIEGISSPWTVTYNTSYYSQIKELKYESDVGPEIIHTYTVSSAGVSGIIKTDVVILWPVETVSSKQLMYLTRQPFVTGNGWCNRVPDVNSRNLQLENPRLKIKKLYQSMEETRLNKTQTRFKRDSITFGQDSRLSCGSSLCIMINCTIGNLNRYEEVRISVPSRLWVSTVKQLDLSKLSITSSLTARVVQLPYGVDATYLGEQKIIVRTDIDSREIIQIQKRIPWWIIIVAVCLGLSILIIIIVALWKFGFFRRKRPQTDTELHAPNGYHSPKPDDAFL